MYILGDIGNSDTKIFLVNKNDVILKRINLPTKNINNQNFDKKIKYLINDAELLVPPPKPEKTGIFFSIKIE